jgi:outer membrane protein OmpA-like peptidoglycan-associated protein
MKTFLQNTILFTLVFLCTSVTYSQRQKVKRADKNFDTYGYINARDIYIKVVEAGYKSSQIYKNLGDTYYWNGDYDNAAIWYSLLISEFPEEVEVEYYYRASQSLKGTEDKKEISDEYMKLYVENGGDPGIIKASSTNFLEYEAKLNRVAINSAGSDFGPSYYLDKIVFSSTTSSQGDKLDEWTAQPFLDLFMADMDEDGKLSNVMALGGDINTPYHESSTTFTKDGKTVYFTRNNYIDGKKGKLENKLVRLNLYKATNTGENNWTEIVELPFNSKDYSVAHPTLSVDEKRLYFSSDMPGTIGRSDIWYVDILEGNTYSTPVNLSTQINTRARESFPFISQGNNLYFSSDGRGGLGGYDVFMVELNEQGIPTGEVKNLGKPTNSHKDDFGFITNEENGFGYVSSNRDGKNGSVADDIYRVDNRCDVTVTGTVTNTVTGEVLPEAVVNLLNEKNEIVETVIAGLDGSYLFTAYAICDSQYTVRAKSLGCEYNEVLVRTPNKTETMVVLLPLSCDPCAADDLGCRLRLEPIYFDYDRFNIRTDAAIELEKILTALQEFPQLRILIESHTDSRGAHAYNEALSQKRAQSILNWLVDRGVDSSRLSSKGFGESQLVNQCADGVQCTDEEHQLNRRSMFIIQN